MQIKRLRLGLEDGNRLTWIPENEIKTALIELNELLYAAWKARA
jgi:hypothetical protein